jgi:hypothetical protein
MGPASRVEVLEPGPFHRAKMPRRQDVLIKMRSEVQSSEVGKLVFSRPCRKKSKAFLFLLVSCAKAQLNSRFSPFFAAGVLGREAALPNNVIFKGGARETYF